MKYLIKQVDKFTDFSLAEPLQIKHYKWIFGYEPKAWASVVFAKGEGFYIKLECEEKNPKATYKNYYDPVYKDSCLEFFVNFDPKHNENYVNNETNAFGTLLCGFGSGREGRKSVLDVIDELPKVTPFQTKSTWGNVLFLPLSFIKKLYGNIDFQSGYEFTGNVYKCGDEAEKKHYGMWNPIELPISEYHSPQFFGTFVIE